MSILKPDRQVIIQKFYYPRKDGDASKIRGHIILNNSYLYFSVFISEIIAFNFKISTHYIVIINNIWGVKSVFEFFIW